MLVGPIALALVAACSSGPVSIGPVEFVGEVASVSFGEEWALEPDDVALARGGPATNVAVGPQIIELVDGRELDVRSQTPGGNWCLSLIHPSQVERITGDHRATLADIPELESNYDWDQPCVIMGQFAADGTVAWFQILRTTDHSEQALAVVPGVERVDFSAAELTTSDGVVFPLTVSTADCGARLDDIAGIEALVDWTTGTVDVVNCLFDH